MSTTELIEIIKNMPAEQQREVEALVSELTGQMNHAKTEIKKKPMKFGDLKGFVTYISDDFDEPLDDFKEYM